MHSKKLLPYLAFLFLTLVLPFSFASARAHAAPLSHATVSVPCSSSNKLKINTDSGDVYCFQQSGTETVNIYSPNHVASNYWSGYLYFSSGEPILFCNNDSWYLGPAGQTITSVVISPIMLC
ncbi:hypothetical protein [Tengunoibacter tsumagoiensis]|nr:hypothetical protein [Tengunoibacter tsumagoiensis]